MAVDIVQAVHSSPAAQNVAAVENAQRNPNPERGAGAPLPEDKVTISAEARSRQVAEGGEKAVEGRK